jgi:cytochrome P450
MVSTLGLSGVEMLRAHRRFRFVDMLPEETALLVRTMQIDIPDKVKKAIDDWHAGIVYERPTIVGAIMESDLSAEEKKPERVADDALAVVGAGTETTAWALAVMTYHLKTRPEVLDKLTREIQEVVHDSRRKYYCKMSSALLLGMQRFDQRVIC